jgi:hypothetical protein
MAKQNEVFPSGRLGLDRLYQGYEAEFACLVKIAQSSLRDKCFSRIINYDEFIKSVSSGGRSTEIRRHISKSSIVYFKKDEEILLDAVLTAHVAICCELLTGSSIPFSVLREENLTFITRKFIDSFGNLEEDTRARNMLEFNLHSADAFRTIQILRYLGLFLRSPEDINQLSLGAGSAKKDIRSIHITPKITFGPENTILFNFTEKSAQDIVIVDGDPSRKSEYNQMTENKELPVFAINNDALEALSDLPNILGENELKKRNTVIGLRIDHRMIPDASDFFRKLSSSITDDADLIITIGSGFGIDDFAGRTEVISELHNYLKSVGLAPFLIKLHGEGSLDEQWNSPSFGLKDITTYQILYCKLIRNKLK